jgi:tRNA (guanine37-N1)-methyltransferase
LLIDVLTLFPEYFKSPLDSSILKNAIETGLIEIEFTNFREFAPGKHNQVDDTPYGGGPGMVLMLQPVVDCLENLIDKRLREGFDRSRLILLSPEGKTLNQDLVRDLGREEHLVLVSGHYEGFDARLGKLFPFEEISIGDYVLSGGEGAALILIETVAREIPGVLGNPESIESESFRSGLLDHPSFTKPPEFRGLKVPDVLSGGNHRLINEWRLRESIMKTIMKRPDLIEKGSFSKEIMELIEKIQNEIDCY